MCDPFRMKKPQHIFLLGAGLDTGNLGVGALTVGAIKCLTTRYPDAEISMLNYGKSASAQSVRLEGRQVSVPVVTMRFSWRVYLSNNIIVLLGLALVMKGCPRKLGEWLIHTNRCLRELNEADFVASIAGGDSFADIYGLERLLYVSLPQILILLLGKKLILLPQTIGPFRRRFSKGVAKYILKRAEHVYLRDFRSIAECQNLLGNEKEAKAPMFCYDVAFSMDPIAPADRKMVEKLGDSQAPIVGVNVSGLLYSGGYTGKNEFGLRGDYREFIRRVIAFLIEEKRSRVVLVPHVFGGAESDLGVCEQIYKELSPTYGDRLLAVLDQYDQNEMKYLIGKCEMFLGSRMHACIAALSQTIPAVSVAYSDKFIGVMETLGIESTVADARELTVDGLLDVVNRVYEQREAIHLQLQAKMVEVRSEMLRAFANLGNTADEVDERSPVLIANR